MDFSLPLTSTFLRMFYALENEGINWSLYFSSYQKDSWMGILTSFILSLFVFILMVQLSRMTLGVDYTKMSAFMAFSFTSLSQVSISMKLGKMNNLKHLKKYPRLPSF